MICLSQRQEIEASTTRLLEVDTVNTMLNLRRSVEKLHSKWESRMPDQLFGQEQPGLRIAISMLEGHGSMRTSPAKWHVVFLSQSAFAVRQVRFGKLVFWPCGEMFRSVFLINKLV